MGGVLEIWFWMMMVACFSFAPLGYFIYMYTMKGGEPFGDIEPHGDSESKVLVIAEKVVNLVKSKVAK